jgi:FkbM family methyltransferase
MKIEVNDSWKEVTRLYSDLAKNLSGATNLSQQNVVIFGAGVQGRVAMRHLNKYGVKVLCFTDNDPHKQGTLIDGIPVVSPLDSAIASAPIVLIAARQAVQPLSEQLNDMGIIHLSFDAYFVMRNFDRIAHVRNDLLQDARSRLSYDGIIKTILTGDNSYCASIMEGNQYFALPEFVSIGYDHFVDAGAYVGDTMEKFIWMCSGVFEQIYAFEPGEPQISAMKHRLERLCREWAISETSVVCENAGLADKDETLAISLSNVLANTSIDCDGYGDERQIGNIRCYSLDSYLAGRPATFIKADIEGMELAMLHGAQETIRRYKPKMALSIYHNPGHLFEIAEYVNYLVPEYKIAVRHHSPIFAESILYCWVP